jgi:hypothetical protein
MTWSSGDAVAWRSVKDGTVRTAMPLVVVRDAADLIALYRPVGSVYKRRTGDRGGPGGRLMLHWDGGHEDVTWSRNRVLVLHRPGAAHTLHLFWDDATEAFLGWYINLEAPWRRTAIGFDTLEQLLDVVLEPDLSAWKLKDEDELEWAVGRGEFTPDEATAIRAEATRAIDLVLRSVPPYGLEWMSWRPDPSWQLPALPATWKNLTA